MERRWASSSKDTIELYEDALHADFFGTGWVNPFGRIPS